MILIIFLNFACTFYLLVRANTSIYIYSCSIRLAHLNHRRSWHGITTPFFYFLITYLFSIKFLYFFIISSLFSYFILFVSIFIQYYVNSNLYVSTLYTNYPLCGGNQYTVPDLPLCLGVLEHRAPLARGPIFLLKKIVYDGCLLMWCNFIIF